MMAEATARSFLPTLRMKEGGRELEAGRRMGGSGQSQMGIVFQEADHGPPRCPCWEIGQCAVPPSCYLLLPAIIPVFSRQVVECIHH